MSDRPVRFDLARIEYGKKKLCQCITPHYEIDVQNRLVTCTTCNAIVEPYEALLQLARHWERNNNIHEAMLAEREAVAGYTPQRKVIKNLESKYNQRNPVMLPTCPRCHAPFKIEELVSGTWVNERYAFLPGDGPAEVTKK